MNNKIDYVVYFSVNKANPNGDPLNGNRPRVGYDGKGEVSDVCLKRKIRNRLMDMGEEIFVQSDENRNDSFRSLKERFDSVPEIVKAGKDGDAEQVAELACKQWMDVRAFGQVVAFKGAKKGEGVSIGIRGPVSVQFAESEEVVDVTSTQITKSVNLETNVKNPGEKAADTMGMKHRVDFGLYRFAGSINPQLAERTGFSDEDAEKIKEAIVSLFENDASSARPEGSIVIERVYWFKHNNKSGQYNAATMHRSVSAEIVDPMVTGMDRYDFIEDIPEGFERQEKSSVLIEFAGV